MIVRAMDLASAGVELLEAIRVMFNRSTRDYLTSKEIRADLISDPEKRWAEWSRGQPITEKGVAALLHEFGIVSRNVGPREVQAKGYRKADFASDWERYATPQKETTPPDTGNFPSTRPPPCNDYTFAGKSAVHADPGGRGKIDDL